MFYQGTLQAGISQAIKQQKLVACFVRDDGATSKTWEDEWLRSGWLSALLAQKAILLRIDAGSTEAGFLGAFCKITSTPSLVVIHNGRLQLQLGSEAGREEFVNQVREVLGAPKIPGSAAATGQAAVTTEAEDDLYEDGPAWESTAPSRIRTPAAPVTRPAPPPAAPSPPVPAAAQSSTPSNANTKGKQRADAAPQAGLAASSTTTNSAQQAARAALQKKKREDAEELARIKARIEQDKAARKAQAEARKAEREQERAAAAQQSPSPQPHPSTSTAATTSSTRGSQSPTVHLSIRLFDGRTIRTTFPRTATLTTHVRPWIDTEFASLAPSDPNIMNRATLPPYFFRHILPPQPSRELSAGDEADSLGDIDLAPSATLVLVPVKGYSDAYAGRGGAGSSGTNLLAGTTTGLVSGAFGLLSSTVGYAGSLLGGFLGGAQQPQGQGGAQGRTTGGGDGGSGSAAESGAAAGRDRGERDEHGNIRVRTLADQRAREPRSQQFYNGNQSNVEPRPDDRG